MLKTTHKGGIKMLQNLLSATKQNNNMLIWVLIALAAIVVIELVVLFVRSSKVKEGSSKDKKVKSSAVFPLALLALATPSWEIFLIVLLAGLAFGLGAAIIVSFLPKKEVVEESVEVEEVEETPIVEEPCKEAPVAEEVAVASDEVSAQEVTIGDKQILARYNRSFLAKLIQSDEKAKNYYIQITNYIRDHKAISTRMSRNFTSFNYKRNPFAKLNIKGKTLYLYIALDAKEIASTKFNVKDVSGKKKYEKVPCLLRITSDRALNRAKKLVDMLVANLGIVKAEGHREYLRIEDYAYDTTENLIARGLIKLKGSK